MRNDLIARNPVLGLPPQTRLLAAGVMTAHQDNSPEWRLLTGTTPHKDNSWSGQFLTRTTTPNRITPNQENPKGTTSHSVLAVSRPSGKLSRVLVAIILVGSYPSGFFPSVELSWLVVALVGSCPICIIALVWSRFGGEFSGWELSGGELSNAELSWHE